MDETPSPTPDRPAPDHPASDGPTPKAPERRRRLVVPVTVAATSAVAALALAFTAPGSSNPAAAGASGKPGTNASAAPSPARSGELVAPDPELAKTARRTPGDPMAIGAVDAPVVMVEYSDFACTYCRKFALETEPALIARYVDAGLLRIEWRDFPYLSEGSKRAALAGRAAAKHGKFWEVQQALFQDSAGEDRFELYNLAKIATAVGIDAKDFAADMADKATHDAVRTDFEQGQAIGVSATPSFIVNGRPFTGAQPLEAFAKVIELAAVEAGAPLP